MNSHSSSDNIEKGTIEYNPRAEQVQEPVFVKRPSTIANPGPAGVFAFASSTLLLSLYNAGASEVHTPNVIIGMAVFTGGLVQLLAGMWEFPRGNVFGATAFSLYGSFWMSYATILIPGSGILTAYTNKEELAHALGLYLTVWLIVTVMFILPVMKRHVAFTVLLSILCVTFILLAVAEFTGNHNITKAGGITGIVTGAVAFYIGVGEFLAAEADPIFRLPMGMRR
ncbi:Ammonia transport outward protein 2 [Hypsizygus marmoreus]|uniref:Ammonia transport outward protein 2 n=1 Tax=Hypsizygus marmoreus TaxID=39966 RepID=A0A369JJG8_HYPMA|nr:Ammonia transport outward protein 2 [Hypsizygus marmoreus]